MSSSAGKLQFEVEKQICPIPTVSQKLFWQRKMKAKREMKHLFCILSFWISRTWKYYSKG